MLFCHLMGSIKVRTSCSNKDIGSSNLCYPWLWAHSHEWRAVYFHLLPLVAQTHVENATIGFSDMLPNISSNWTYSHVSPVVTQFQSTVKNANSPSRRFNTVCVLNVHSITQLTPKDTWPFSNFKFCSCHMSHTTISYGLSQ